MLIKNVKGYELDEALDKINEKYKGNITWNRFEQVGRQWRVTLRVKDSHRPGARLGYAIPGRNPRHLISACWHVHGDFYDALFQINPNAVVKTSRKMITKDEGNWEDWNIGSIMYPLYYSEACECH